MSLAATKKSHSSLSGKAVYSHDNVAVRVAGQGERPLGRFSSWGNGMMHVKLTASYYLTTEHAKSRFGQPVLVNQATGQAFLPSDAFAAYESWQIMPATQVVSIMASYRNFAKEERTLIDRFLGIQRQPKVVGAKQEMSPAVPDPLL